MLIGLGGYLLVTYIIGWCLFIGQPGRLTGIGFFAALLAPFVIPALGFIYVRDIIKAFCKRIFS